MENGGRILAGKSNEMMDPSAEVNSSPIGLREENIDQVVTSRVSDFSRRKPSKPKSKRKVKVDEEDVADIAFWSAAKRQSWAAIETNPNAFYYRHVAPGQTKRTGAWDEREKKLFMETIKIHPPSQGKWGLFAQHIPGRVGYQCRNFYHRLLESGELTALPEELEKMQRPRKKASRTKKPARKQRRVESDSDESVDLDSDDEAPSGHDFVEPTHEIAPMPERISTVPAPVEEPIPVVHEPVEEPVPVVQEPIAEPVHVVQEPIEEPTQVVQEIIEAPPVEDRIPEIPVEPAEQNRPKWTPRMKAPWTTLQEGRDQKVIVFPSPMAGQVEYESSRILRKNQDSPLNMMIVSFPAPPHRRAEFVNAVRERLAYGSESEKQALLTAYFRTMDEMGHLPGEQRFEASNRFVDFVVQSGRCDQ